MIFPKSLIHGTLIKRYKRFLADIKLDDGEVVVAHTTNSGSMKSCIVEGAEVYLTHVNDPKRKTQYTWEMIKIDGQWVGVNTIWPNVLAYEAISNNEIAELSGYLKVQREVKFQDSRFDVYCENANEKCFVEVKNVTMKEGNVAKFPDAITTRGQKHLRTLMQLKNEGYRAVMLYIIQRSDIDFFEPAKNIDPDYAKLLKEAYDNGVEIFVMQAKVMPKSIELIKNIPFSLE